MDSAGNFDKSSRLAFGVGRRLVLAGLRLPFSSFFLFTPAGFFAFNFTFSYLILRNGYRNFGVYVLVWDRTVPGDMKIQSLGCA